MNNRLLAEPYPENEVWLNADAARSLPGFEVQPLRSGEQGRPREPGRRPLDAGAAPSSPSGSAATASTSSTAGARPRRSSGTRYGRGASDSQLTSRYKVDPIMGGTGMNVNFVRVERAGEAA